MDQNCTSSVFQAVWRSSNFQAIHKQKGSPYRNRNLPDNHSRSTGVPMPLSQAIVNNGKTNIEQQVWSFVKQSSFWAITESVEPLRKQKPHFSLLKKMKEGCREAFAIGYMAMFENVIRDVLNYQPSNPIEKINNSLELLDELEPHGFDVSVVRGRLNTLLSSKVKFGELKDELKRLQSNVDLVANQITEAEHAIEKLAASPL